jgi:hypothetical protein
MTLRLRSSTTRIGTAALLSVVILSAGVLAVPAIAGAASSHSSNVCSKVSASSVAAIVGYPMKAPTFYTRNIPASSSTDGVSGAYSLCTYDDTTTTGLAGLQKEVDLSLEITSKALTIAELKQGASKAGAGTKVTVTSYPGLGLPALYLVVSGSGTVDQEITVLNGKMVYTANIANKTLPKAKLASIAKLAGKL